MLFLDILCRIPTIFLIDLLPNSMKLCWMHFCLSDLMTPCPGVHNGAKANSEITSELFTTSFKTFRLNIRMFQKYPRIINIMCEFIKVLTFVLLPKIIAISSSAVYSLVTQSTQVRITDVAYLTGAPK